MLEGVGRRHRLVCPLIVQGKYTNIVPSKDILKKHKDIYKRDRRLQKDVRDYLEELGKIERRKSRKLDAIVVDIDNEEILTDCEINWGIAEILEENVDGSINLLEKEDAAEERLNDRYKDAIDFLGPKAGGIFGRIDGFECRLYSNDHDTHFHVIHKGKQIDARFSFPELKLISHKGKKTISSQQERRIIQFLQEPETRSRLEMEFKKRGTAI